jgi:cytochrome P450
VHEKIRALIARRRSSSEEHEGTDMLSALLAAGSDGDLLLDELMTVVLAGHDTTATALAWAFDLLLHHPRVLDRLRRELAAGDETYLDAVIQEVLRLRPVIGETGRVPRRPFRTAAGEVPAGTVVMPSIYLVHTDPVRYPEPLSLPPRAVPRGATRPGDMVALWRRYPPVSWRRVCGT